MYGRPFRTRDELSGESRIHGRGHCYRKTGLQTGSIAPEDYFGEQRMYLGSVAESRHARSVPFGLLALPAQSPKRLQHPFPLLCEDPFPVGIAAETGQRDGHAPYRMHPDTDAPAPGAFDKQHLPRRRVVDDLGCHTLSPPDTPDSPFLDAPAPRSGTCAPRSGPWEGRAAGSCRSRQGSHPTPRPRIRR